MNKPMFELMKCIAPKWLYEETQLHGENVMIIEIAFIHEIIYIDAIGHRDEIWNGWKWSLIWPCKDGLDYIGLKLMTHSKLDHVVHANGWN
jgi:hypothetical protein